MGRAPDELTDEERRILELRAHRLARPLVDPLARAPGEELLELVCAGHRYALPQRVGITIRRLPTVVPLPHAPPQLLGVALVDGEVLPCFSLARLLGLEEEASPAPFRKLLVAGMGRPDVGLVVDDVLRALSLPEGALAPLPEGASNTLIAGITPDGLRVLDGEALLAHPRLSVTTTS